MSTIEIVTYGITGIGRVETLCDSVMGKGDVKMLLYIFRGTSSIIIIVSFLSCRFHFDMQISTISLISKSVADI